MSAVGFGDELVRDYLVFRGFLSALKAFDSEVKADKDRGFRPDRIVEHLSSCILNLDLCGLRDAWAHLDHRFFARLEHSFLGTARKLENALLRMFLVTCVSSGRHDKLLDFFEKMTPDLQGQPEWKEWFAFPFTKNPDEHPAFAVYFTRHWQDTMLLSLHNFMSVVFQSAAMPTLLSYEEDLMKIQNLTEENEILKRKVAALEAGVPFENPKLNRVSESQVFGTEMMDDFFVIAQECPAEVTGRSIKSLIRNMSSGGAVPTSPHSARKTADVCKQEEVAAGGLSKGKRAKPRSPSVPPRPALSLVPDTTKKQQDQPLHEKHAKAAMQTKFQPIPQSSISMPSAYDQGGFLILSTEKYAEHNSLITHCKFNCSGTMVASSDMDGVIKIWNATPWNATPSLSTLSTIMSKTSVLSLEWAAKRERLVLYGGTTGVVRLYDTKERIVIKEVYTDNIGCSNQKVLQICCSPLGNSFVVSTDMGQLALWDCKAMTLQRQVWRGSDGAAAYCCSFNHNGQLLLIGTSDGTSSLLDLRTSENIATWNSHSGSVLCTQFSIDETSCYTIGSDGKFVSWSVNLTGHRLRDLPVHPEAVGSNEAGPHGIRPLGKLFTFNSDGSHVLTCGPLGGILYQVGGECALDIGGHHRPVSTVDWSAATECSTCVCGTVDGRVIVSTLLNQ